MTPIVPVMAGPLPNPSSTKNRQLKNRQLKEQQLKPHSVDKDQAAATAQPKTDYSSIQQTTPGKRCKLAVFKRRGKCRATTTPAEMDALMIGTEDRVQQAAILRAVSWLDKRQLAVLLAADFRVLSTESVGER
ncbi:uncharacterized protein UDID_20675 [Ustilago sp. UG-2017a]|nr:uncharacterized protein UDID_20675 [Ustilago sp. UG-2017a]